MANGDSPLTFQIGSFVLDDTNGVLIQEVLDATSPPMNLDIKPLARKNGGKLSSYIQGIRKIKVSGRITGTSWADCDAKLDAFKAAVIGANLNFDVDNGTYCKRYIVSTDGPVAIDRAEGEIVATGWSMVLTAVDPPFGLDAVRGAAAPTVTNAFSSTGISTDNFTFTPTYLGSAPPAVKYTITVSNVGSITGLELQDFDQSRTIQVNGTFANGDVVVIDAEGKQVTQNNLPIDFTGQFPDPTIGSNPMALNPYTSTGLVLDQSQTVGNRNWPLVLTGNRIAQSFQVSTTGPVSRVSLVLGIVGTGHDVGFSIQTDSAGAPSGTVVTNGSATISASALNSVPNWYNVNLSPAPSLTSATTYWIVLTPSSSDLANYMTVLTNYPNGYANGKMRLSANSGSTYADADGGKRGFTFKVYRGALGETNSLNDSSSNLYSEGFTTTAKKDGAATTANWDTANAHLVMFGVDAINQQNTSFNTANYAVPCVYSSFGSSPGQRLAQSIQLSATKNVDTVEIYGKTTNAGSGNLTMTICADNSGQPGTVLATASNVNISGATSASWHSFSFPTEARLTSGTTYWIVLISDLLSAELADPFPDAGFYWYGTGSTSSYASGSPKMSSDFGSGYGSYGDITAIAGDFTFKIHTFDLSAAEYGQSTELASTQADILSVSHIATGTSPNGSTYVGQASADNGTTWFTLPGDTHPFDTDNVPAVDGSQLKYRAVLQNLTGYITPVLNSVAMYWKKGISLNATTQRAAQSFVPAVTGNIQRLDLIGMCAGSPGNITVRIETDSAGAPSGTLVSGSATVTQANPFPTTHFGTGSFTFGSAFSLTATTKYWIIVSAASVSSSNKYLLQANNNHYSPGNLGKSTNSGTSYTLFTTSLEDLMFTFYQAGGSSYSLALSVDYVKRYE